MTHFESPVRSKIKIFENTLSLFRSPDDPQDTLKLASKDKNKFSKKYNNPTKSSPDVNIYDFSLICTLGKGSFGRVILAYYKTDRKFYALKVLKKRYLVSFNQVENTMNERNILSACDHPNILKLYATFKDNSNLYLMTEVCLHSDLYSLLKKNQHFDEKQAQFYAANVFLAFEYLHVNRIIFRDLKPENVMIAPNGYLKIIDFGFSKRLNGLTKTMCGTPDYLSPEMLKRQLYGKSTDWWSFGIFVFELNAGKTPFQHLEENEHLFVRIRKGLFKIPEYFSDELSDLCRGLLQSDVSRRLGCLKNESNDIKEHKWFQKTEWMPVYKQTVPAPYVPEPKDPFDYVNKKPEKEEDPIKVAKINRFSKEFKDF